MKRTGNPSFMMQIILLKQTDRLIVHTHTNTQREGGGGGGGQFFIPALVPRPDRLVRLARFVECACCCMLLRARAPAGRNGHTGTAGRPAWVSDAIRQMTLSRSPPARGACLSFGLLQEGLQSIEPSINVRDLVTRLPTPPGVPILLVVPLQVPWDLSTRPLSQAAAVLRARRRLRRQGGVFVVSRGQGPPIVCAT